MAKIPKPTSISLTWWKAHKPKSIPKSDVDDLIGVCSAMDLKAKVAYAAEFAALAKKGVGPADVRSDEVVALSGKHVKLVAELKRVIGVATKEKHVDFVAGLEALILVVKAEQKAMDTALGVAAKQAAEDAKKADAEKKKEAEKSGSADASPDIDVKASAKKITDLIKEMTTRDTEGQTLVTTTIAEIAAKSTKAKTEAEFGVLFGQNKFVLAWLKQTITKIKQDNDRSLKDYDDLVKMGGALSAMAEKVQMRAALEKSYKGWDPLKDSSKALDKTILVQCAKALGKEVASTVFLAAKPVTVNLKVKKTEAFAGLKLKKA